MMPCSAIRASTLYARDVDASVRFYTALYEQALAAGAPSVSTPHDFLDGRLRAAWVAGPDGNPVQFVRRQA